MGPVGAHQLRAGRRVDDRSVEGQRGDVVEQPVRMLPAALGRLRAWTRQDVVLRHPVACPQRPQVRACRSDGDPFEGVTQVRHVGGRRRDGDPLLPLLHGALTHGRLAEQGVPPVLHEDRPDQRGDRGWRSADRVVRFQHGVGARRGEQRRVLGPGGDLQADLADPSLDGHRQRPGTGTPGAAYLAGVVDDRIRLRHVRGRGAVATLEVERPLERTAEADVEAALLAVRRVRLLRDTDRDGAGGHGAVDHQ